MEIVFHRFLPKAPSRELMDPDLLHHLKATIEERFKLPVRTGHRLRIPEDAYNRHRNQYRSDALIEELEKLAHSPRAENEIHLGMTDVDIFSPRLNFVFGEAIPRERTAVFSLARFLETPLRALLFQRAETEAVHELGHVFGLDHCDAPGCVMWFSNRISETDRKGSRFCPHHQRVLDRSLFRYGPKVA